MVKSRPVVVISPKMRHRAGLVTVVPLSTVEPSPVQAHHMLLSKASLPQLGHFQMKDSWLKGDMLYTVGFHRLNLIRLGKRGQDGKRLYFKNRLGRTTMAQVYRCVMHGMGMPHLVEHV